MTRLGVVVPCFNEEEVLSETSSRLLALLTHLIETGSISPDSAIFFVDDGSTDSTWSMIEEMSAKESRVHGIKLSCNRGHQNALLAGLFTSEGDALISVDADLQDDLHAIEQMIDDYHAGSDIVYGVRKARTTDSFFKRVTAEKFYTLMRWLGATSIRNHADYRLMSRRAIENLKEFREVNLFLRGIVPLIGYKSSIVYYDRAVRFAGESKYPLKKMLGLALDAITSFSVVPLRLIMLMGFLVFLFSVVMASWTLWIRLFTRYAVPGWASTLIPLLFLGGVQILCVGVIGEYLGKIYREVKARPRYIIEKMI